MRQERRDRDRDRDHRERDEQRERQSLRPGVQLARLLRRWWVEAAVTPGGRPTQQALAARLGVDQTTLSRYLNPQHPANAPLRVVDALHAQLRAPAEELPQARALCRAALAQTGRQRGPAHSRPAPGTDTLAAEDTGAAETVAGGEHVPGRPRLEWALPALMTTAVVVAFTAGAAVHVLLVPDREVTTVEGGVGTAAGASAGPAGGTAGASPTSGAPYAWPLLRMGVADQYTRARALQHLLNWYGYPVAEDGYFTGETRDAVVKFQREQDLAPDGEVDKDTWPELVPTVGPGSRGRQVLALQELLDNVGQGGTPVSGTFTSVTAEDLRFFQRTYCLPVTGRAGPETWRALLVNQQPPVGAPAYPRPVEPYLTSSASEAA
ncbi:peptidoglycan-binding protein [Streptomyces sp. NPDC005925]|uniref:peptidoglycan-binding protein n=1 Tax=Streptomyces sp. NPDC005925 TaxID=3157172 RepID=UPI0033FFC410